MSLTPLLEIAYEDGRFRSLATDLAEPRAGEAVHAHISGGMRAYLLAALVQAPYGPSERSSLLVTPDDRSARDLAADMSAFLGRERIVRHYPSRGTGYASNIAPPPHLAGLRVAALEALAGDGESEAPPVVVASAIALAEAVPEASLRPAGFQLSLKEEVDLGDVAELLAASGYDRVDQVEQRGQFAVRGDILDVYPATEERAVRIELFGDEIESMRWFSTFTQRSLGDTERIELAPAAELDLEHREMAAAFAADEERPDLQQLVPLDRFIAPLDLVPGDALVIVTGAEELATSLRDHWQDVTTAMHAEDAGRLYVDVAGPLEERAELRLSGAASEDDLSFRAQSAASPARNMAEAEAELEKLTGSGYRTIVAFERKGEAERARYNLARNDPGFLGSTVPEESELKITQATLRRGFVAPQLKLAVIPFRDLVHSRRSAGATPAPARSRLSEAIELRVGDFVVHEDHGIARFAGFETKTVGGVTRDYLELEYKGEDKVFAPTEQLAKISRYLGADGGEPTLSALGGKRWLNLKARARRAAQEMAGDLLNLYAERQVRKGYEFSPDGEWQLDFEGAFPYSETPDQADAIDSVKGDMESERPMDRLICGDVGYGKTEVALRAAHKAAADGKQVMLLVPTTILAQQHLGTFKERFADTAFSVDMVSRLRSAAETKEVLARFSEGKLDILIGTHRLLSRDVRGKDLGLLIVDEEQRFGVKQKDLLRQLKLKVDVLAMSATPIPRTLQMSLAGLRDISVIETPPEGRRPVRTYVGPYEEDMVKRSIERELERGGQAFFLHNRIDTLHETAERLRALVPDARFAEAHGQMDEHELEDTMLDFMRGGADCLVATTIIESGLDIPNANTLIVERSDQLGLSQAYQIRGRVGRSRQRAFAYLLYPSAEALTPEAAERLSTLSDNTELGSGFRVAMRDLEIRGAGNLLGDEQSGHVAAVGFELYCQMLEEAAEAMRAAEEGDGDGEAAPLEPVRVDVSVDAYVPASYVPFEAAKIDVHRRIAAARDRAELGSLKAELEDRFGAIPEPVENLLELQRARLELAIYGVRSVEFRGGRLSLNPVEIESDQVSVIRDRLPGASYEWREHTLVLRLTEGDDPAARLKAILDLVAALAAAESAPAAA